MATLRDGAAAAYQTKLTSDRAALVAAAQNALIPVFTDAAAKLFMDPTKTTTAVFIDERSKVVVLTTTDGSNLSFQVDLSLSSAPMVYLATGSGNSWTVIAPALKDLDDIGKVLADNTGV